MNRLKLWKIVTPIMGVAAVGSIAGAVGYYFYKTAPEKWNNALQEFREVHLGFDGNQMIGYLATGQYADQNGKDSLITWEEEETQKTVYVINEKTKEVTKYELKKADEEKSIIATLPGNKGDKFKIIVESKGITFRNETIRKNAFENAPQETDAKKLRNTLRVIKDKNNALMDYDDEDIKPYTKTAAAEFKLNYMSGDVTLMGLSGKVDTPIYSYIKSLDYDDILKTIDKTKVTTGDLVGDAVPYKDLKLTDIDADEKKVVKLHPIVVDLGALGKIGSFAELALNPTPGANNGNIFMMPRAMADVSPGTQFIGYDVVIETGTKPNVKSYDLGKLERYNNEFVVSEANGIYKDAAAKTADAEHYGDLKITSWW